jgi:hypothetical protein
MSKGGGSKTATSTSRVLPEYEKFANENLSIAGTMANTPHMGYKGERLSDFSDDEMAAFERIRQINPNALGLGHGVASQVSQAAAPLMNAGNVAGTAQQLMNPYQQNVVDTTMSELQRQNQMALNQVGQGAAAAGAFGGSRHGVAQGETNRGFADAAARAAGQLNQSGYQQAMADSMNIGQRNQGAADANLNRQLQAAQQMQSSGQARMEQDLGYAGALAGSGASQRDRDQAVKDLNLADFYEQQNHPLDMLSLRQQALGLTPLGSVQKIPVQRSGLNFGSLLGGLGSLAGGLGGTAGLLCWVARAVYGIHNPRWLIFRQWMLHESPAWFRALYLKHGEKFAEWIANKPLLKRLIRAAMDVVVDRKIRESNDVAAVA